jgi:hypothetical protein
LRICVRVADDRIVAGDTEGAIQLLLSAASQYPCPSSETMFQKAAALGGSSDTPLNEGLVRGLAELNKTEIAIRRRFK